MFIKDWRKEIFTVPNLLSLFRLVLIPIYVAIYLNAQSSADYYLAASILAVSCLTDMIDGKIARKYNLITDFGKFMDPVADKFMVIGTLMAMLFRMLRPDIYGLAYQNVFTIVFFVAVVAIIFRELAITSLRLVLVNTTGTVVAAKMLGKIKTVSQMAGTVIILIEPLIPVVRDNHIPSYVCMAVMLFTTLFSGLDYLKAYMPHISTND